jgi:hypothetical protein
MSLRLLHIALLLCAVLPAAAQKRHQMMVDDKSGSVLEITGTFSLVPPTGYAPVRVRAINNTTGELTVTLRTNSNADNSSGGNHQLESAFTFAAAAGKTTEREFMVPLCSGGRVSSYYAPDLECEAQAGGRTGRYNFDTGGYGDMPFTAFSTALAGKSISDINSAAAGKTSGTRPSSYGRENFAALYDPAMLPADWRGYSGLDVLAISAAEWSALQAAVKSAALQWVKLGGALVVYVPSGQAGAAGLGIPLQSEAGTVFGGKSFRLGMGLIVEALWGGAELDGAIAEDYRTLEKGVPPAPVRRTEYAESLRAREGRDPEEPRDKSTPLVEALGEKDFAAWQVGIILFIFGIVVGPVNLFYLAGKGRRHRLFFTTPIISLAAAALLLVVIFFQDGTGGKGHRTSLVYLDSAENTAIIHQMQVSRTGVLFGGAFELSDPAVVSMAVLPESRWTRLKGQDGGYRSRHYSYSSSRGEAQRYSAQDKSWSGDYFQSRSEQGHFIDTVRSTRGRIERKPGSNPPVITSTIAATLDRVVYHDADGRFWASDRPVTTGAEVTLTEISGNDLSTWRRDATAMLHQDLRKAMDTHQARNFFYASSTEPAAGLVDTLDSIEWQSSNVFLYGPLQ